MRTENTESEFVCFAQDTQVCLPDGSGTAISSISTGDSVLALDKVSGKLADVLVETVVSSLHTHHVLLSLVDGTTLACTDDHPLFVDGKGWSAVENQKGLVHYGLATKRLTIGDKLTVFRGGVLVPVALVSIDRVLQTSRMWIIGTGKHNTFFANGVLAHDENVASLELSKAQGVRLHSCDQFLQVGQ